MFDEKKGVKKSRETVPLMFLVETSAATSRILCPGQNTCQNTYF
jgi:hypothetical protein